MKKRKLNKIRKKKFLEALQNSLGVITVAARKTKIPRETHYVWYAEDLEYRKAVEDIKEVVLDVAESKLYSLVNKENPQAVFFLLKTIGKKRGYIEKQEIESTVEHKGYIWNLKKIQDEMDEEE